MQNLKKPKSEKKHSGVVVIHDFFKKYETKPNLFRPVYRRKLHESQAKYERRIQKIEAKLKK